MVSFISLTLWTRFCKTEFSFHMVKALLIDCSPIRNYSFISVFLITCFWPCLATSAALTSFMKFFSPFLYRSTCSPWNSSLYSIKVRKLYSLRRRKSLRRANAIWRLRGGGCPSPPSAVLCHWNSTSSCKPAASWASWIISSLPVRTAPPFRCDYGLVASAANSIPSKLTPVTESTIFVRSFLNVMDTALYFF